jgi:acetate kinase
VEASMKILVLNAWSSSLKSCLYEFKADSIEAHDIMNNPLKSIAPGNESAEGEQ